MRTRRGFLKHILNEIDVELPIGLIFDILRWAYNRLKEFYQWLRKRIAKWKKECHRLRGKENIECNLALIRDTREKLEKEKESCEGKECEQIDNFLKKLDNREKELRLKLKGYK